LLRDNTFCGEFAEVGSELLLCLPMQTNTPKDLRLYTKTDRSESQKKPKLKVKTCLRNSYYRRNQNITKEAKNVHFGFFDSCRFYAFNARTLRVCAFAFPNLQDCTNQNTKPHVTPSTAAVCKL